jgi:hypothetical protein
MFIPVLAGYRLLVAVEHHRGPVLVEQREIEIS